MNDDIVKTAPTDWADLQKSDYANAVALAGDPRVANQAIQARLRGRPAAAQAAGADAATAGLEFFADLNKAGNFVPVIGKAAPLAQGTTPIVAAWDYNALAWTRRLATATRRPKSIVPSDGVVAGVYVQAISAYAPHPNAAKLWMEYLYSDEGQLGWLAGLLPPDPLQRPRQEARSRRTCWPSCRRPIFTPRRCSPRSTSRGAAKDVITKQWDSVVGANVK